MESEMYGTGTAAHAAQPLTQYPHGHSHTAQSHLTLSILSRTEFPPPEELNQRASGTCTISAVVFIDTSPA